MRFTVTTAAAASLLLAACTELERPTAGRSTGEILLVAAASTDNRDKVLAQAVTQHPAFRRSAGEALLVAAAEDETRGSFISGEAAPSSAYGDYLAGLVATQEKDLSSAADFMLLALKNDPEDFSLLQRTFMLVASDGRHVEAVRLARRVVEQNEEHAIANMVLAVDSVDRGDHEAAAERLASLADKGLNKIAKPILEAWLHVARGDTDEGAATLESHLEDKGFGLLYQLHRALVLDLGGRAAEAGPAYEDARTKAGQASLRLAWLIGNFFERQGQTEKAREVYDRYLSDNPGSVLFQDALEHAARAGEPKPVVADYKQGMAEGLFNLAGLLSQERAEQMALVHLHAALRLEPEFEIAKILLGEILESQERSQAAIDVYRQIDPGSPFTWTARLRIAEELDRIERTDEAISELEALATDRPDYHEPLFRLGNLLRTKERFEEAVAAYDRAFERLDEPGERNWTMHYFRGIALERSKDWDRAEADFLEALELQPEQPYVMNYLAYSWVEKKMHLDEAKRMLARAVELRPNDGFIVDSLGWAYYRLDEFDKAVKHLEKAVELRPQDPVINDHLGDAYWQVGRLQEARFQWRRALSLEPETEEVPKIEAKIKNGLEPEPKNI